MSRTLALALSVAVVMAGSMACSDNAAPGGALDSSAVVDATLVEAGTDKGPAPDLARLDAPMTHSDGPVTVKPDGPVTLPSDGPVTVKPDGPVILPPNGPVILPPDGPVTLPPDGPVTPAPDGPVTLPPDGPVTPAPDGPVTPAPDGSAASDGPPPPPKDFFSGAKCVKHCDCPQGLACMAGGCINVGAPVYCCTKSPCPAGAQCADTSNTWSTCAGGTTGCKSHCDCNQGEACQSGKCVKTTPPTYCCAKTPCPANTLCYNANDSAGICMGSGTTCKTHCDCTQGQTCVGGSCFTLMTLSYCCSKSGCPSGKSCYSTTGIKSFCP